MRNFKYLLIGLVSIFFISVGNAQEGQWSEPVLVDGINTLRTDYYPSISHDGMKMYFVSYRGNNEDIYVSERVNGQWDTPVNLGSPVNSDQRDNGPSISADGRTLYFISYNREGGYGGYDIWYSEWDDSCECWSEPLNAGPNVNTWATEWSPSISHDGNKLYFATSYPYHNGHVGALDLYVSEMGPDGWETPVNLGLGTYSDEYCPSIASDDTTLYFASWHHHFVECWHGPAVDLFAAYFSDGQWGNITNLCDPVNTDAWERSPSISSDGDTLYFASRINSEFDNIYYSVKITTGIEENISPKSEDSMRINISPNPFNSSTTIRIYSAFPDNYSLSIYNLAGQLVYEDYLFFPKDEISFTWNGKGLDGFEVSSGLFFITVSNTKKTYKTEVLKIK